MDSKELADTSPLRQLLDRGINALIERARRDPYEHLSGYMERYWLLRPRSLVLLDPAAGPLYRDHAGATGAESAPRPLREPSLHPPAVPPRVSACVHPAPA